MFRFQQMMTALVLWCVAATAVGDELKLASIFCDGVVLQRGIDLPIWGTGIAGTAVDITFAGQSASAVVSPEGNWRAKLKPCEASSTPAKLNVIAAGTKLTVQDVLVGEVWLAAGQSNMQMTVQSMIGKLPPSTAVAADTNLPNLRVLRVNEPVAKGRQSDFRSGVSWQKCDPESVKRFSAVAWVFARRLHKNLDIPIGIIDVSWGGKPIEPFIPSEEFAKHSLLTEIKRLADSEQLDKLAALEGGVMIRNPEGYPGAIYDARIRPLEGFGLRGFLWYQAESNCGNGEDPRGYRHKMQALTNSWRRAWNRDDLPLYFVQLPNFRPEAIGWIRMREEQRRSVVSANTAMVVTIDTGSDDIHPANKYDVGERLAKLALRRDYGRKIVDSGPLFKKHTVVDDEVTVHFSFAESGLMLAQKHGLKQPEEDTLKRSVPYFQLAAADGVWHPAEAIIQENRVIVTSSQVSAPQEVRYACLNNPSGPLLYNQAGLPASPFCSKLEWLPWGGDSTAKK